jgi:hypothetical protein
MLASRVHRECHLSFRKACLRGNYDRPRLPPKRQQPELISRSLFTQQSHASRQIAYNSQPAGNKTQHENSRTTAAYLMRTALPGGMPLKRNHLLATQTPHSRGNRKSTLWLSPVSGNLIFKQRIQREKAEDDVPRLTILSAASATTVAQVAKDAEMPLQGVHEIQVTLRTYKFSPGSLRVRKGELVKLIMAAADHDHGFKLGDFNIN